MAKRETLFKVGDLVVMNKTYLDPFGDRYKATWPYDVLAARPKRWGRGEWPVTVDRVNAGDVFTIVQTWAGSRTEDRYRILTASGKIGWISVALLYELSAFKKVQSLP